MGCETSQAVGVMPEPYLKHPPAPPQQPQWPNIKISFPDNPPPTLIPDKENIPQAQTAQNGGKPAEKSAISETKIKPKPEKRKSGVPIVDLTNIPSHPNEPPKPKPTREDKAATSRSGYKEEVASLGPSSKSIQLAETARDQNQEKKPELSQERKAEEKSEKKAEQKQGRNFVLQQWEKTPEEDLSRTQRLKKLDQAQIEREEVSRYINEVWDFEKDVVNNLIDNLEFHQIQKYDSPLLIVS